MGLMGPIGLMGLIFALLRVLQRPRGAGGEKKIYLKVMKKNRFLAQIFFITTTRSLRVLTNTKSTGRQSHNQKLRHSQRHKEHEEGEDEKNRAA